MKIADFEIYVIQTGSMLIDGGICFSGVPKSEWEKVIKPDSKNRVELGVNQIILKGKDKNILIDTGTGNKENEFSYFENGKYKSLDDSLLEYNLSADQITHLIFSHLHSDHAGGATKIDGNQIIPVFKNAEHIIQIDEWKAACNPDEVAKHAYCAHDFIPLFNLPKLRLVSGNIELFHGISIEVTSGHTAAHQTVIVEDENTILFYPADITPTPLHLNPTYREAFDVYPSMTLSARKAFLRRALQKNSYVVFSHSETPCIYKITGTIDNPIAEIVYEP